MCAAGKTPSSASAYQVLLSAFPAMHASAYRLLRLLASTCRGALTPLYAGLISVASSSLQRIASEDSRSFASGSLCSLRSEVCTATLQAYCVLHLETQVLIWHDEGTQLGLGARDLAGISLNIVSHAAEHLTAFVQCVPKAVECLSTGSSQGHLLQNLICPSAHAGV